MSATLKAEQFSHYFGQCPVLSVPGRTFPVQVQYLEDVIEATGIETLYALFPSSKADFIRLRIRRRFTLRFAPFACAQR